MATDSLFRMTVEDVFSIKGRGTVATGKIETGTLKVGDEVEIHGNNGVKKTTVSGIEMFRKMLEQASPGDAVGILLRDVTRDDIHQGDVILSPGSDFTWQP